ncbi:MAG: hypothetical protein LBJ45_02610 [Holosporaceae bacterium]|nr:hypothetical protein [Holosporaceae bacterium]
MQATKVNISATARTKFSQKQQLQAESTRKIAATVREVELAGTGVKVRVPVKESLAQTEAFAMRGKAPGGTAGEKNGPQTPRINKQLTREELAKQAPHLDKAPYTPRTAESMLNINNPESEITSTTLPKESHPNVKPVGPVKNKETVQANGTRSSQLLPGEGEVGAYKALSDRGNKGDNITPDHMPSAAFMSKFGKKRTDGICMNIEHYHPGEGGRHRVSRTYGNTQNAESTLSPRSELATDIWDRKKIYQEDGLYDSAIRESLQDVIKQNKETFPDVFKKGKK